MAHGGSAFRGLLLWEAGPPEAPGLGLAGRPFHLCQLPHLSPRGRAASPRHPTCPRAGPRALGESPGWFLGSPHGRLAPSVMERSARPVPPPWTPRIRPSSWGLVGALQTEAWGPPGLRVLGCRGARTSLTRAPGLPARGAGLAPPVQRRELPGRLSAGPSGPAVTICRVSPGTIIAGPPTRLLLLHTSDGPAWHPPPPSPPAPGSVTARVRGRHRGVAGPVAWGTRGRDPDSGGGTSVRVVSPPEEGLASCAGGRRAPPDPARAVPSAWQAGSSWENPSWQGPGGHTPGARGGGDRQDSSSPGPAGPGLYGAPATGKLRKGASAASSGPGACRHPLCFLAAEAPRAGGCGPGTPTPEGRCTVSGRRKRVGTGRDPENKGAVVRGLLGVASAGPGRGACPPIWKQYCSNVSRPEDAGTVSEYVNSTARNMDLMGNLTGSQENPDSSPGLRPALGFPGRPAQPGAPSACGHGLQKRG